jgi:DNA polymerase-3 subunit delta
MLAPMQTKTKTAAVTVVVGDEELLVERAIAASVAAVKQAGADVRELLATELEPGQLAELTSPSLFGDAPVLVLRDAEQAGKDVVDELITACRDAADADSGDARLVLVHRGGARGKVLLDAALGVGARRIDCAKITKPGERIDFVKAEARAIGKTITDDGARALVDAVGNDLRDLAAACAQLGSDTDGRIDAAVVARYYRGRAEANGFAVADRAVEGRLGEALEQLRWALAVGTAPVLIASALAQGVRSLAKVGTATSRGLRGGDLAREVGLPPWMIDRVKALLHGWGPDGVAAAVHVVAEADAAVKGGGTDAAYALEKAVLAIVAARDIR